jgi:hypothetical protein
LELKMYSKVTLASALVLAAATSAASAAIIPSWRINPISPAAITANPQLANAMSVSLMVELTGGSLFNVGGLDLASVLPGVTFFNQANFGSDTRPNPSLFPLFPDVEFDSYVATTGSQAPAVPGKLNGIGAADVGQSGFNVAWGATPNTGGTGLLEIARITMLGGTGSAGVSSIPLSNGLVADSLNPNVNVALPPIPNPFVIPEPMSFALAGLGLLALRRK